MWACWVPSITQKTEYTSKLMVFLGCLLGAWDRVLVIPDDKKLKAANLLNWAIQKRKVTIKFVQQLTGMLNFSNKAIVPGRAFMKGMYIHLRTL